MGAKLTREEFIEKAQKRYGTERFCYAEVEYINQNTRIKVKCLQCGEIFFPNPDAHLRGASKTGGCITCGRLRQKNGKLLTLESFLERSKILHNDKYDYSLVTHYENNRTHVEIICPCGNIFKQTPRDHLTGRGCKKCAIEGSRERYKDSIEDFISKAQEVHGTENYDYSLITEYTNRFVKVPIKCNKCGCIFEQQPSNHLAGNGCPKCPVSRSKNENAIKEFCENDLGLTVITSDRSICNGAEIDIFIPELKLAIEYNGVYWHSEEVGKDKHYHLNKTTLCEKKGIRLLHIWDYEYLKYPEKIFNLIKLLTGKVKNVIKSNETSIVDLSSNVFVDFCKNNHIQNETNCTAQYGLKYNDIIIMGMGFRKTPKNWELARICYLDDYFVDGGMEQIFNHFLVKHKPQKVILYNDNRLFNKIQFSSMGFKFSHSTSPKSWYFKKTSRKYILEPGKEFEERTQTEEFKTTECLKKYGRIWDCGSEVWNYTS